MLPGHVSLVCSAWVLPVCIKQISLRLHVYKAWHLCKSQVNVLCLLAMIVGCVSVNLPTLDTHCTFYTVNCVSLAARLRYLRR